jgi:protein N-terminal methyltransferase
VWAQWVMSQLTDTDFIGFVRRCLDALKETEGVLVLKENMSRSDAYVVDEDDCSVARSEVVFKTLFEKAGAKVVMERMQYGFPDELFPVKMFALKAAKA